MDEQNSPPSAQAADGAAVACVSEAPRESPGPARGGHEPPGRSQSPPKGSGGARRLERRALGGTLWTLAGFGGGQVIRLLGNLALTRLLFPEAFGVMALVHAFVQGLSLWSDVGIGPSIVQNERGDDPRFLDTAWVIQAVRGVVLTLASWAIAYPVYLVYAGEEPLAAELLWLIPLVGGCALLDGLSSTRVLTARRHLALGRVNALEVGSQGLAAATMVGCALISPALWVLAAGSLVKSASRTALSYLILPGHLNRPGWDPEAARALFRFGRWVAVSTVLTFLASQSDRLLFGKLLPWEALGIYWVALNLALLPSEVLARVAHQVVFPALSRLRFQAGADGAFTRYRLPVILGGGALIGALLPAGPAVVDVLYDARYAAAGWMLQLLLVGAWFRVLEAPNSAALLALGRTGSIAAGNAAKLASTLVLLPGGYWLAGLPGAIAGYAAADLVRYLVSAAQVRRAGLSVLGGDAALTLLLAATALAGATAARALAGAPPLVIGVLAGAVGVLPWAAAALLLWRSRRAADAPAMAG